MKKCEEASIVGGELEEKEGFEAFIKIGASAITRLLVKKGILTEEEICEAFLDEVKRSKK